MVQSSSFVQHQPFQLYLLRKEFQLDEVHQNDGEKDAGAKRRRKKCGKIKIYSDELVFTCSGKFFIREKTDCTGKPESKMRRNSKSDAVSSSQGRLKDADLGGLMDTATEKLVAPKEESGAVDLSESETWSFHEEEVTARPIACKTVTRKPGASSKSENSGNPKAERKEWPLNLHMSPATIHHTEVVFSIVRGIYERVPADPMEDLDVDAATWGIF